MAHGIDENQVLTQSIAEHAVTAIGRDRIRQVTVTFDARDASCIVAFVLRDNSDDEQLRAIDKLLDVKLLFIDEAVMDFRINDEVEEGVQCDRHPVSQRQFSIA